MSQLATLNNKCGEDIRRMKPRSSANLGRQVEMNQPQRPKERLTDSQEACGLNLR
jgi:hypothetical protein